MSKPYLAWRMALLVLYPPLFFPCLRNCKVPPSAQVTHTQTITCGELFPSLPVTYYIFYVVS